MISERLLAERQRKWHFEAEVSDPWPEDQGKVKYKSFLLQNTFNHVHRSNFHSPRTDERDSARIWPWRC